MDLAELDKGLAAVKQVGTEAERAGGSNAFAHVMAGLRAVDEQAKLTIDKLARVTEIVGGIAGGGVFGHSAALLGALNLPLAGAISGMLGMVDGLIKLSDEAAKFSVEISRTSELLGINAQELQTWTRIGEQVGIDQQRLTMNFLHFQRELADGAPNLKAVGLSLKDVGITSTDLGTALRELSRSFSTMTDPTERNAAALALFGRNAGGVVDILKQGPAAFDAYTKSLQAQGLMLDDATLRQGAAAQAVNEQLAQLWESIKLNVGVELMGVFEEIKTAILNAFGPTPQQAIHNIAKAIADVVGAITSFLQGLFGVAEATGIMNQATAQATAAYDGQKSAIDGTTDSVDANAAANKAAAAAQKAQAAALEALRRSTQLQTQALDDQIAAMRQRATEFAAAIDAQISAAKQQETAVGEQVRMSELLQQQQDEQHQSYLSHLQEELAELNATTVAQRTSGESLMAYEQKLKKQQLETAIKKEQDSRAEHKTSTEIMLENLKIATAAHVSALEEQKKAEKDATDDLIKQLDSRKTALDRHLQAVEAAQRQSAADQLATTTSLATAQRAVMAKSGAGMVTDAALHVRDMVATVTGLKTHWNQQADDIGTHFHNMIVGLFQDPGGTLGKAANDLGEALGSALVRGALKSIATAPWSIGSALGASAAEDQAKSDLQHAKDWKPAEHGGKSRDQVWWDHGHDGLPPSDYDGSYAMGGFPSRNVPFLAGEYGPEIVTAAQDARVFTSDQTAQMLGGGGSHPVTFVINYYGPQPDEYVMRDSMDRLVSEVRRRGVLGSLGAMVG